jgi:exopolysaccharide production protein ExoQ
MDCRKPTLFSLSTPALCLSAAAILTPPVSLFAGLAAAPIFVAAGMVAIALVKDRCRTLCRINLAPSIWVAAVTAWALITVLWTQAPPGQAIRTLLGFSALALLGMTMVGMASRFAEGERNHSLAAMMIGVSAAAGLLLIEVSTNYLITRTLAAWKHGTPPTDGMDSMVSRGAVVLGLMLWPALAAARKWGARATVPLLIATVAAIAGNGKHASMLALAVGAGVFIAAWAWRRPALHLLRIAMVAVVLGMPLMGSILPQTTELGGLSNSARHRIVIWRFALDRVAEHPLRGWGIDSSRALPGGEAKAEIVLTEPGAPPATYEYQYLPLHPHSGPLQLWLELGVPGALLAAAMLWWLIGRLMATPGLRVHTALAAAALANAFTVSSVSFGIWQSWWQSALWLTAIFFALIFPGSKGNREASVG